MGVLLRELRPLRLSFCASRVGSQGSCFQGSFHHWPPLLCNEYQADELKGHPVSLKLWSEHTCLFPPAHPQLSSQIPVSADSHPSRSLCQQFGAPFLLGCYNRSCPSACPHPSQPTWWSQVPPLTQTLRHLPSQLIFMNIVGKHLPMITCGLFLKLTVAGKCCFVKFLVCSEGR